MDTLSWYRSKENLGLRVTEVLSLHGGRIRRCVSPIRIGLSCFFLLLVGTGCQNLVGIDTTKVERTNGGGAGEFGSSGGLGQGGSSSSGHGGTGGRDGAPAGGGSVTFLSTTAMGGAAGSGGTSFDPSPSGGATTERGGAGTVGGESAGGAGGATGGDGFGGMSAVGGNTSGAGGSTGAGGNSAIGGATTDLPRTDPYRIFITRNRWLRTNVSICYVFDESTPFSSAERLAAEEFLTRAKRLVASTWQRSADVNYYGWVQCAAWVTDLRFEISMAGSPSSGLGDPPLEVQQRVRLPVSATDAEILYYFGRAIGFGHEYDLEQQPGPCVRCKGDAECTGLGTRDTCLDSGFCGRPSDHASIMAAPDCGGIEPIRSFSPWDIAGARRGYGHKPVGSLVSAFGGCLAMDPSGVWYDLCFGFDNDTVGLRTTDDGEKYDGFASVHLPWDLCLRRLPNGNVLTVGCDVGVGEPFGMATTRLRGLGGLCVVASSTSSGAPLTTALCGTTDPRLEGWQVTPSSIRLAGTTLCATSADEAPDVNSNVVLAECGTLPGQQTVQLRAGRIQLQGLCFDVGGGLPIPGSRIILWNSCPLELENDDFYFSGPVSTESGYCLTPDPNTGTIAANACGNSTSEEWDYHF